MKIFSKGNKANKSMPIINATPAIQKHFSSSKPKNNGKLTIFKKLLSNSNNQLGLLPEKYIPEVAVSLKVITNVLQKTKACDSGKSIKYNRGRDMTSPNKVIVSKDVKVSKTEADCRSTSESIQKIGNSIRYLKICQNKQFTQIKNKAYNNFIQKQVTHPVQGTNIDLTSKEKTSQAVVEKENYNIVANRQNQSKKMNHYKNTRLNFYNSKPTIRRWSLSCFRLGRKVGRGRFGSVYMAEQKNTGFICALKLIDLQQLRDQEMEGQITQQIKLQSFLKHPNILKMYGFFREEKQLCMILEYAEDRCLFHKLNGMMEEKYVANYTKQMIDALKYCHSESVLHRDLKPENILLSFGVAKLADFGWAAYAPKFKRLTFCGTLDYVPPEILNGEYYDQRVDIWSLGVLIYQMATGKAPFESPSINPSHAQAKTMRRIKEGDLNIPVTLSPALHKLINSILKTEPSQRPSLEQIESNMWMKANRQQVNEMNKSNKELWVQSAD